GRARPAGGICRRGPRPAGGGTVREKSRDAPRARRRRSARAAGTRRELRASLRAPARQWQWFPRASPSALPPAEQPLDVGELELHVGRPAVIALAGIGGRLHFAQQRVHLLALEAAGPAHLVSSGRSCGALQSG